MPNRAERREAERIARKLAIQQSRQQTAQSAVISDAQLAANRANAQLSHGPVTEAGKATSSMNALKHGLTGQTVLLDAGEADAYQQALNEHVAEFQPITFEERRLTQSAHDCAWRLNRILELEFTIYAKGRIELESSFLGMPEAERKGYIRLETAERYAKQLKNLHIQEARLQRQRAKDIAALKKLIEERKAEEAAAAKTTKPTEQNGFVFENPQVPAETSPEPVIEDIGEDIGLAA
jgi:hypothetical protein